MRPRTVDWLLCLFVSGEVITGLISFTISTLDKRWLFVVHGMLGLALVVLVYWKMRRVWRRLTTRSHWDDATLAAATTFGAVLLTFVTGLVWTGFQWPLGYPNGMILHTLFGLWLLFFMVWHMVVRYKPWRLQ